MSSSFVDLLILLIQTDLHRIAHRHIAVLRIVIRFLGWRFEQLDVTLRQWPPEKESLREVEVERGRRRFRDASTEEEQDRRLEWKRSVSGIIPKRSAYDDTVDRSDR